MVPRRPRESRSRSPGLRQVAYRSLDSTRFFAVYRFSADTVDAGTMRDWLPATLARIAARRPGQGWPLSLIADRLMAAGRDREALALLAAAQQRAPADRMIARMQDEVE